MLFLPTVLLQIHNVIKKELHCCNSLSFCGASGKNTTDIALVIDAMDILRDGLADCFCLVASDGDYTLLAQRIREAGLPVLGYGEGKTPAPLVRACTEFLYADCMEGKPVENTPGYFLRRDMEYFDRAFEEAADGKTAVSYTHLTLPTILRV